MAALVSIMVKVLVLVETVSDYWAVVNAPVGYADCFSSPVNITVAECGQQLGSMLVSMVLVLVRYGAPVAVEVLQGMVGAHVPV
jgi:hypothetical protein